MWSDRGPRYSEEMKPTRTLSLVSLILPLVGCSLVYGVKGREERAPSGDEDSGSGAASGSGGEEGGGGDDGAATDGGGTDAGGTDGGGTEGSGDGGDGTVPTDSGSAGGDTAEEPPVVYDGGTQCADYAAGAAVSGVPTWAGSCDSTLGFQSSGGSCYFPVHAEVAWTDARATCRAAGGYLITVDSAAEHDLARSLVSRPWIGACLDDEGWGWVGGQAWSYTQWAPREPSGGGERCGEAFDDGASSGWNDYLCDQVWVTDGFVCEFG